MALRSKHSAVYREGGALPRSALLPWALTVAYMGLIFYLSSRSGFNMPLPMHIDKVIHMCIYIPLAFLFSMSLRKSGVNRYLYISAFILATLYGATDEFHQLFVEGRDASVGDLLADGVGAMVGSMASMYLKS